MRRRVARVAASVAIAIGLLDLAGWLLDLRVLTGVRAGWVEMRPITAAALLCVGTAIWIQTGSGRRALGIALAALGAASAALTLGEWLLGRDLGIDLLLLRSHVLSAGSGAPGRMAGLTAVCLLLVSAASAASGARGTATRRLAEASGVLSGLIAGLVLLAYVYGEVPAEIGRHVPMAANTALACLALAVGAVAALPESDLVRAFDARPPGGLLVRRLLPSVVIVVVALGWIQLRAQAAGLVSEDFSEALQTLAVVVCLGGLVLVGARALNRADAARREAEQRHLEADRRLLAEFDNAGVGLAYVSPQGRFLRVNRRLGEMLGYPPEELLTRTFQELTHPAHRDQDLARHAQLLAGEGDSYTTEKRYLRRDGSEVWISLTVTAVRGPDGKVSHFFDAINEIGDRHDVEERLRQSESDYRQLVEQATIGIFRSLPDGRLLSANPALAQMLGCASVEEALGLNLTEHVYAVPAERAALLAQLADRRIASREVEWTKRDGTVIAVRLRVRSVTSEAGDRSWLEGLAEDVTQQRLLEAQLRQAQRLEAVGRLAGGVAHDFNNVLTAITGYTDLVLDELQPGDPRRRDLEEVSAAANRAAGLTRQLLAFSRKQVLQPKVLDINALVRALDRMLQRLIGEDVRLELALAPSVGAVRADPGQLEQVILNLAVNSRDAMPNGGRITIETADLELDDSYAREHPGVTPGPYVMLALTDTGIGMDAEVLSHLFEPFFTTKEQGKGTGLGLATVYGIVNQSGGHVWVYSEPGRGATFKVYLPWVGDQAEPATPRRMGGAVPGGTETVLLAEDDHAVREIASAVLLGKGYRVLRAPDGQTALEMAGAHEGAIDLLLTDLVMPGMTGRELAEALAAARAGVRVLFMSGYTDDAVVRHGVLASGLPYLQKPFSPDDLARKVREVLDRP